MTAVPFDVRLRRVEYAIGDWNRRRRNGRPSDAIAKAAIRASRAVYFARKAAEGAREILAVAAGNCPRCDGTGQYRDLGVCFRCGGSGH